MTSTRLSPASRDAAARRLADAPLDVLVVGGGVVGAAAALDAVTRGLSVGLVEARDWGSGHSSCTGRLIEGGLARLPDVTSVRAAVRERDLLLDRLAPHLVKRVPLLRPLHHGPAERLAAGSALALYDTLAALNGSREVIPAHRELTARAVRRIAIALDPTHVTGGVQRYEALVDDARLALTLVRTAAGYGAIAASRVRVERLERHGDRVVGVVAYDRIAHTELRIAARVVVAATGGVDLDDPPGSPAADDHEALYAVVPRESIRTTTGLVIAARTEQPVTLLPWGRHWIVGPGPDARLISLLDRVNPELAAHLTAADVEGTFLARWPRTGAVEPRVVAPGLVSAVSPDLSRYRLSARAAVDAALEEIGGLLPRSISHRVPLLGADGFHARWNQRHLLARRSGVHVARVERLLNRYGSAVEEVLVQLSADRALAAPLDANGDYLRVEVVHAVSHEGARHLTDVLSRRLRLTTQARDGGLGTAADAAALMAGVLGWDDTEIARQVRVFATRLAAVRTAG